MHEHIFEGLEHRGDSIKPDLVAMLCGEMMKASPRDGTMPAGLTYLGQMISHDIIPSSTAGANTFLEGRDKPKPKLNLASLYGDKEFRKEAIDRSGKFILGYSCTKHYGHVHENYGEDLLRKNGRAVIPESRNDENVLVSQLHLFFLRFHNKVVDEFYSHLNCVDAFKQARKFVRRIFKRLVVDEFLYHVLDPVVFNYYFVEGKPRFYNVNYLDEQNPDPIPYEFSKAVFRFGHSMVREDYRLQRGGRFIDLQDLFIFDHGRPLSDHLVVQWQQLFGLDEELKPFQTASLIDMHFASAMSAAPSPLNAQLRKKMIVHLVGANLAAGLDNCVPTGGQVVKWLCENCKELIDDLLSPAERNAPQGQTCCKSYKHPCLKGTLFEPMGQKVKSKHLPLFLYILLEDNSIAERGTRLGRVGSIIIAEVLANAMKGKKGYMMASCALKKSNQDPIDCFRRLTRRLRMMDLIEFVDGFSWRGLKNELG